MVGMMFCSEVSVQNEPEAAQCWEPLGLDGLAGVLLFL